MAAAERRGGFEVRPLPPHKKEADEKPEKTRLEQLFEELGGEGLIKVYRATPAGDTYSTSFRPSTEFLQEPEQHIGDLCGCGRFRLKFYRPDYTILGSTTIEIDPNFFPEKKLPVELKREGLDPASGQPQQAKQGESLFEKMLLADRDRAERERERAEARQAAAEQRAEQFMRLMFETSRDNTNALIATIGKQRELPAHSPMDGGIEQIGKVVDVAKKLGVDFGGGGGGGDDKSNMSALERITQKPLEHAAERIVDKVTDKWFGDDKKKEEAPKKEARDLPPPPEKKTTRLPPGARPLTAEDLAAMKKKKGAEAAPSKDVTPNKKPPESKP